MIALIVGAVSASAGFAAYDTSSTAALGRSWSAMDTSSAATLVQQPAFNRQYIQQPAAYIQQPSFTKSWSALDTASSGAFVTQPAFAKAYTQPASYIQQPSLMKSWSAQPALSKAYIQPSVGYGYQAMESASATNPYNANMLNQNIAPLTVQASRGMPVKQIMGGEQHVVDNDLQLHVNHEADKTVLTKRLVHHSPVLHKTIRTHQIAQDVVHDKQVHHMNVVEDRVKQVPGKEYIGTKQQVDHTTANPAAVQPLLAGAQATPLKNTLKMYNKF